MGRHKAGADVDRLCEPAYHIKLLVPYPLSFEGIFSFLENTKSPISLIDGV